MLPKQLLAKKKKQRQYSAKKLIRIGILVTLSICSILFLTLLGRKDDIWMYNSAAAYDGGNVHGSTASLPMISLRPHPAVDSGIVRRLEACSFGQCLEQLKRDSDNGSSGSSVSASKSRCAFIYPLRYMELHATQDLKDFYDIHKRTMHFETITLINQNVTFSKNDDGTVLPMKEGNTTCTNSVGSGGVDGGSAASAAVSASSPIHHFPEYIIYFHIFKNGGTTIRNAFMNQYDSSVLSGKQSYKSPKILFTGRQSQIGTDAFHKRINITIQRLFTYQKYATNSITSTVDNEEASEESSLTTARQEQQRRTAIAFTFLREPISRFLSGLGQVLHKYYVSRKLNPALDINKCFTIQQGGTDSDASSSTLLLIDCVLDLMIENKQFYDFHLLPQLFLLRDFTGELDIEMLVMDVSQIDKVLSMLLPQPRKEVGNDVQQRRRKRARPSRFSNYTGGHDLNVEQLTTKQIQKICQIYYMDVDLLIATGVSLNGKIHQCINVM